LEMGVAGNVGDGRVDIVIHLRRVGDSLVVLVVERQEEYARDQG
jgi:hypothetical protein